jgi:murein DD-endopeptidase MepM/ murein hydrolase activator NlpD
MKSILKGAFILYGKALCFGFFAFLLIASCRNRTKAVTDIDNEDNIEPPVSDTTFVLRSLGVNFGPWDPATNRAGDFLFNADEEKVFIEFGAEVAVEGGGTEVFPAIEYRVDKNALVTAVAEGRVVQLDFQGGTTPYYKILVRSTVDPRWEVRYDHVRNPRIAMDDTVSAGTVLGNPGAWNATLGRIQIMVIRAADGLSYCPFCVFDPDSVEVVQSRVLRHMADWESFKNDATIYDEENQILPGCKVVDLNGTEAPELHPEFMIHGLGVNFGPWDPATNRAGDFLFKAEQTKVFLEFGAKVGAGGGGTKELPTFEYKIDKNALVAAVAEGRIVRFEYQSDTQDYEILAQSIADPVWSVGYDHIKNIRVAMGDTVLAGTVLGNPGTRDAELGRFEIMVNNYATGLSYCPFCVFDPDSVEVVQSRVRRHMTDWEAFKNDATIYDEENHVLPGCRYRDMITY